MTPSVAPACATHSEVAAGFQCCECGELLCNACVQQGSHLLICRLCGERAIELDELERAATTAAIPEPTPSNPSSTTPRRRPSPSGDPSRVDGSHGEIANDVGLWLANHLVIPAATIAMVSALLFFLLDVRSVYLGGTAALKQIGFCFASATVLIARYGRSAHTAENQGCYTAALGVTTLTAMILAPWDRSPNGSSGSWINLVIIVVVWRFATRLTANLSLDGLLPRPTQTSLYGTERIELEDWRRQQGTSKSGSRETRPDGKKAPANPVVAVARLAVIVLFVFALGEPLLLSGPPAVSERAMASMIVFLFATGVLLAASAGLQMLRRVRDLGGQIDTRSITRRMTSGGLAMVAILAVALSLSDIAFLGNGSSRPAGSQHDAARGDEASRDQGRSDQGRSDQGRSDQGRTDQAGRNETGGDEPGSEGFNEADRSPTDTPRQSQSPVNPAAATQLIGSLSTLGQWLRIPLIIGIVLLGLYGLWRLRASLGRVFRSWVDSLRNALARFTSGLFAFFRRAASPSAPPDPLADLTVLRAGEPREAVLTAYARLLGAFEHLGHSRSERHTPYEFLATLPNHLKPLANPAQDLTRAYVTAAYSHQKIAEADREAAIATLERFARLRPTPAAPL